MPVLLGLGLLLFVVNLGGYPLYTKGEPREAVVVRDILQGGGVILPMRAGVEIPSKPPLMHWLAALVSVLAGRVNEWTVRLPSATLAILGMIACYLYVRRLFDQTTALFAAFLLGTTLQYVQVGTGARVDMTLAFFMEVAFFEFLTIAEGLSSRRMLLYLSLAAAVLVKGPIGLLLPAMVAALWLTLEHRLDLLPRLRLMTGAAVLCLVAGGWYLAAMRVGGMPFVHKQVLQENLFTFLYSRRLSGGHAHPFYYIELALLAGFFPWSVLLPGPLLKFARKPGGPRVHYLLVWLTTVLIFFNLAHSKRGVYLLALYPALATLTALFLTEVTTRAGPQPRWVRAVAASAGAGGLFGALSGLCGLLMLRFWPAALAYVLGMGGITAAGFVPALENASHVAVALPLIAVLAVLGAYLACRRPSVEAMVAAIVGGFVCLTLLANLVVVPAIANTLTLKQFTRQAMEIADGRTLGYLGALNYDVAFYSGKSIPIVSVSDRELPAYLLVWTERYRLIPPAVRDELVIILKSGPTELDGSGGMMLLKRAASGGADGEV